MEHTKNILLKDLKMDLVDALDRQAKQIGKSRLAVIKMILTDWKESGERYTLRIEKG